MAKADLELTVTLTAQEQLVVELLAEAWNAYLKLPEQHPMHRQEFAHSIHEAQRLVLSRPVTRAWNDARPADRSG